MSQVQVKICGITRLEDALAAVEAGADYLGFVFAPSSRKLTRTAAAEIVRSLPPGIVTVGVFVDTLPEEIEATMEACGLAIAQLHGSETIAMVQALGRDRCWKALRIRRAEDLDAAVELAAHVGAIVLDAYSPLEAGGSGRTFDWRLAVGSERLGARVALAGGLRASNVAEAIRQVRPSIVDVSSGVESAPGRKDPSLMQEFVRVVKETGGCQ